MTNQVKD